MILSVRPVHGKPGQRVKINLSIENAMGVSGTGMQVRVAYDPAKLQPWAQAEPGGETVLSTGLSRNLTFTDNGATANGELVINGSGGSLEPGAGKMFTLQFEVAAGLPKKTTLGVTISGATMRDLNGNALVVEILPQDEPESDDTHIEGDIDGDGNVTNADKNLLKDLTKPKSRPPTEDELMAGDLNGDGKLNEKDLCSLAQLLSDPNLVFPMKRIFHASDKLAGIDGSPCIGAPRQRGRIPATCRCRIIWPIPAASWRCR